MDAWHGAVTAASLGRGGAGLSRDRRTGAEYAVSVYGGLGALLLGCHAGRGGEREPSAGENRERAGHLPTSGRQPVHPACPGSARGFPWNRPGDRSSVPAVAPSFASCALVLHYCCHSTPA